MFFTFIIAFISLIGLAILHEFGHFILAKKFGVKVEEFGIGYPPRLFGKKLGGTLYSLNLLPFGAFVKIAGEEGKNDAPWSFGQKPIWQRALIILGGVISFWVVSAILLTIVMGLGVPSIVEDAESQNLVDTKVQIITVVANSPAEKAGIKVGDAIQELKTQNLNLKTDKVKEVQDFVIQHKGQEITLTIKRGKEVLDVSLVPRSNPSKDEGAMGVALVRTALKAFPWYLAPIEGVKATVRITIMSLEGWGTAINNLINGKPTGVQLMGPVGIFSLFTQVSGMGFVYFLQFVAVISIFMALFNILPIPAVDGGKLLFLIIEKIKGKPIKKEIEQKIEAIFFSLLILLAVWVTIKDIIRLF